ncbi:rhodanese-like domain-containing protein [Aliivibrio wodanis]|uniref:Rhodanese-related sulfurtransferase n=1 Tax=Aliivibrio wodanis TaxID=80852 RepID=A0A090I984_9GAMM|nr:rhodanese-related sulfurtransferase [Aliivibrio wodanis]VVV06597.1 Sulfurtransferase [Aliivibrio wodanis]
MKIKVGLGLLLAIISFGNWASERSEQAWSLVEQGALLIDVRTPNEFNQGHLKDAANLPLSTVDTAFANIDKDTPIVVYCRSGNRSGQAMSYLKQAGFTQIHNGGGLEEMLSTKP